MNRVEDSPKYVALKLERAHCRALQLRGIAMFQRNRERFIGVASRLGDSATEVIEAGRIDPGIKFFKSPETRGHQIGCEKFGERRCNGDRPRLSASEVYIGIYGETSSGLQMPILRQLLAR